MTEAQSPEEADNYPGEITTVIESHDHLWHILESSGGEVVADLWYQRVGARPFLRVVDGELEAKSNMMGLNDDGEVAPVTKDVDVDVSEFESLVGTGYRAIRLIPVSESPFGGTNERD